MAGVGPADQPLKVRLLLGLAVYQEGDHGSREHAAEDQAPARSCELYFKSSSGTSGALAVAQR